MVCEEDLAARVFRSWEQHATPGKAAAEGAALAASAGGVQAAQAAVTVGPSARALTISRPLFDYYSCPILSFPMV